jgi:hypothetical protein
MLLYTTLIFFFLAGTATRKTMRDAMVRGQVIWKRIRGYGKRGKRALPLAIGTPSFSSLFKHLYNKNARQKQKPAAWLISAASQTSLVLQQELKRIPFWHIFMI